MSYKVGNEQYKWPPLLVIDYRVICHKIYNHLIASSVRSNDYVNTVKSLWALLLNRGPSFVDCSKATVVIVDDTKPYWRNEVLPEYKAGRPEKSEDFYSVANIGLEYVTNPKAKWSYLSRKRYEADDFAGAIVGAKRICQAMLRDAIENDEFTDYNIEFIAKRPIVLWTVDTDWLQLAGEGVYWANTGPWVPLLRYVDETIEYAARSQTLHKQIIKHPSEIVDIKVKYGDKADNIPAGSPRYLIDLINIPPKYNLRFQPEWVQINSLMQSLKPSITKEHWELARNFLMVKGYNLLE